MADWRKLAKVALLADGKIDDAEVAILRRHLFADKRIDRTELEFLFEAQKGARQAAPSFQRLLFEGVRTHILMDGKISADEAAWLKQWIFADGKVDDAEKKLLKELKLLADQTCPEFEALCAQCLR